jgi:hypothetical protein
MDKIPTQGACGAPGSGRAISLFQNRIRHLHPPGPPAALEWTFASGWRRWLQLSKAVDQKRHHAPRLFGYCALFVR